MVERLSNDHGSGIRIEEVQQRLSECFLRFGPDTDANIALLTRLCGELSGAACAFYARLEGAMLCFVGQWRMPENFSTVDRAYGHVCYEAIARASDAPVIMTGLQKTPFVSTDPLLALRRFDMFAGRAAKSGDIHTGCLSLFYAENMAPVENLEKLLDLVARAIGIEETRKRNAEATRESEEQFRNLVENTSDWVWEVNEKLVYTYSNPRASDLLGYTPEEISGRTMYDLLSGRCRPEFEALMDTVCAKREPFFLFEKTMLHKSNDEIVVETSGTPVFDNDGVFMGYRGIDRDVTERKRLEAARAQVEEQLNQAMKLESVGQLAAGIAHEINTPTQFVGVNLHFMKDAFSDIFEFLKICEDITSEYGNDEKCGHIASKLEEAFEKADIKYLEEEVPKAIDQSNDGINRISKIVSAMKDFSHPDIGGKTSVDINRAIETTITIARNEWKYVAEMRTDLDPELKEIVCLPGDFNQVILNLVVNAAQAISEAVSGNSSGKGVISVVTRLDGDWAEIRVSDTGPGIPLDIRHKIFDPFFTTKEVGKGTGQGLAIVYNIVVNKHRGTITFDTEKDKGATFIVRLPVNEDDTEKTEQYD